MKIYFAPLEGITDEIYRRAHFDAFGGCDKYFTPFVSPTQHFTFSNREQQAISPVENAGMPIVVQVLTKVAEHFAEMTRKLRDIGYTEVNLNAGCPSGTVTAKGKGSGLLRDKDALRLFLDEVYAKSVLPVSIKTRIGYENPDEWDALSDIYKDYPISEIIVHMRTRQEFYKGETHKELLECTLDKFKFPVIYNGDLFFPDECEALMKDHPRVSGIMLGRGLIANPSLARIVKGGKCAAHEEICAFHEKLLRRCLERWPKNAVSGHMCEIMMYMSCMFEQPHKMIKALRKTKSWEQYEETAAKVLKEMNLSDDPGFSLMMLKG